MSANLAIGIDLGGTKIAAGIVTTSGEVLTRLETQTPSAAGAAAVVSAVKMLASELRDGVGAVSGDPSATISAVGIGAAGVIDPATGVVLSATDTIVGWAGTELGAALADGLGLPVASINDVHAHALGETWRGAGTGLGTVLLVAAGTGVGGSLVIDGAPLLGTRGAAGHLGHVPAAEADGLLCTCGGMGHLEMIAAGPAIHASYLRAGGRAEDARAVFANAEQGDERARAVVTASGRALGRAIGGFLSVFDPDLVVVGGGLASAGALWWSALRAGVAAEAIPLVATCRVVPAELGADAAIVGAARRAFQLIGVDALAVDPAATVDRSDS